MTRFARTQAELAVALDVSRRTVTDWAGKPSFPARTKLGWNVARVEAWRATREIRRAPARSEPSAGLERFRLAKAALCELQLAEREQSVIPRDQMHEALGVFGHFIRRATETLQRRYGPEARDILAEALDDGLAAIRRSLGDQDGRDDDHRADVDDQHGDGATA